MPIKPKNLVFRIRKQYYEDIIAGKKTVEYRKNTEFWQKRVFGMPMSKMNLVDTRRFLEYYTIEYYSTKTAKFYTRPFTAVFICGKRIHRREITDIELMPTPEWFSDQGKEDIDTSTCFAFHLGKEM